jgi:hypothetical protein
MPSSLVFNAKQYEAYVTVLAGEAGGPLIYIDAHGHIHVVPTTPDSKRIAEELQPMVGALQKQLAQIAERVSELGAVGVA